MRVLFSDVRHSLLKGCTLNLSGAVILVSFILGVLRLETDLLYLVPSYNLLFSHVRLFYQLTLKWNDMIQFFVAHLGFRSFLACSYSPYQDTLLLDHETVPLV